MNLSDICWQFVIVFLKVASQLTSVFAFSLYWSGIDFKMKTLEVDGTKVRVQIW